MGISPEFGPKSAPDVSFEIIDIDIDIDDRSITPFDFSGAAVIVMERFPDFGREMWRALLRGEAGKANQGFAVVRLRSLFRVKIGSADLDDPGDRTTVLILQELLMEFDPDYEQYQAPLVRPGLKRSNPYEESGSSGFDMAG